MSPMKMLFLYFVPKLEEVKNSMAVTPIGMRQLNLGSE